MNINTPISLGELLDKISILKIKKEKIKDKEKLVLINNELNQLQTILTNLNKDVSIDNYLEKLMNINLELWAIEDNLRDFERRKIFDQNFINLARSVYFTNDKRSEIKLEINNFYGSDIVEVKSYEKY